MTPIHSQSPKQGPRCPGPGISCSPAPLAPRIPAPTPRTGTPLPSQPRAAPLVPAARMRHGAARKRPRRELTTTTRPLRNGPLPRAARSGTGWIQVGPWGAPGERGAQLRPSALPGGREEQAGRKDGDGQHSWEPQGRRSGARAGAPPALRAHRPEAPWLSQSSPSLEFSTTPASVFRTHQSSCSDAWTRSSWPMPGPIRPLLAGPPLNQPLTGLQPQTV